jgi:hypothetical protein
MLHIDAVLHHHQLKSLVWSYVSPIFIRYLDGTACLSNVHITIFTCLSEGCTIKKMCNGHIQHMHLHQSDSSVVAEHSIKADNCINSKDTTVPARMAGYRDCLGKEASEVWLHPSNLNRGTVSIRACQYCFLNCCLYALLIKHIHIYCPEVQDF